MTVQIPNPTSHALREVKEALGERILLDPEVRDRFRSDCGRLVDHEPGAVARCTSAEEVAEVVRFCRDKHIPLVPRGQAHTQSGQATSRGGIVLDTSAMAVIHDGQVFRHTDVTSLRMRPLSRATIERYVAADQPLDCAGAYKLESRGVALFEKIDSADHSAITGLPLMALVTILRELGYEIP